MAQLIPDISGKENIATQTEKRNNPMDISENKLQKGQQRYVQGYYCNTREE